MNKLFIDLTHTLDNEISTFPGTPPPLIQKQSTISKDGYQVTSLHLESHHGTHVDAPSHFKEGLKSIDQFPVSTFVGPGIVLKLQAGKQIDVQSIPEGIEWVLFCTGWSKHWKTEQYQTSFPSISESTAKQLVKRSIKGVGVDSLSIDDIDSKDFQIHHIILQQNLMIVENLTNLQELIGKEFEFTCLPLKIIGCDGSPVRAIARVLQK